VWVGGTNNNLFSHNLIGVDADETARGNGGHGILIGSAAIVGPPFFLNLLLNTLLTGLDFTGPSGNIFTDNVIAYNGATGDRAGIIVGGGLASFVDGNVHPDVLAAVEAQETNALNNAILGNSIYSNGGLGIDLSSTYQAVSFPGLPLDIAFPDDDGVTSNDNKDIDSGANNLQNFPVLKGAAADNSDLVIKGKLKSEPNKDYRLDFYASPAGTSIPVEGKDHLGFIGVSTNKVGKASFKADFEAINGGSLITATATEILVNLPGSVNDEYGSTSEFSAATAVTSP